MANIDAKTPSENARALAITAVRKYYADGRKMTDETIAALQAELDDSGHDTNALYWSLTALCSVCVRLNEAGDAEASDRLATFIKAQRVRYPALESAVLGLAQDRADGMVRMVKAAPMFGVREKANGIALRDLAPQKRIR
jgi:hypothetical protein